MSEVTAVRGAFEPRQRPEVQSKPCPGCGTRIVAAHALCTDCAAASARAWSARHPRRR